MRVAQHRTIIDRHLRGRSPMPRRALAELRFRHTAWIERKPGAMWDVVPGALNAAVR